MNSHDLKNQTNLDNECIENLENQAQILFDYLDNLSNQIRLIENKLSDLKAHFPFRKRILEEINSTCSNVEKRHQVIPGILFGYTIKTFWYLGWEQDETLKAFRLFLTSEEWEIVGAAVDGDHCQDFDFSSKVLFKKPLIETNIATRAKLGGYLRAFVMDFSAHLAKLQFSLSASSDPDANLFK